MLDTKNLKSTMYHKHSRLNQCESNGFKSAKIVKKFRKRMEEVKQLLELTDKIKNYIKENKQNLIEERKQVEKRIFEIQV